MAQQQADALALLAEAALDHGLDPGAPGERYQVVVHVDAAALADPEQPGQSVLEDGRARSRGNVAAPGVRREPGGDAARRGRAHRRGRSPHPDDSAARCGARSTTGTRLPLPRLRAAVRAGHHLHHWAQGGPTTLSNLALLCRRHRRAVHEDGYSGRSTARQRAVQFRRPDRHGCMRRGPGAVRSARGSGPGPPRAARRAELRVARAPGMHVLSWVINLQCTAKRPPAHHPCRPLPLSRGWQVHRVR